MNSSDYVEKLKDPRWQKKRLEVFQRDNWTCKKCGEKNRTLHIHHLFYFPSIEPWDIPRGFLLTLCEDCHTKESKEPWSGTSIRVEIASFLDLFWEKGFIPDDLIEMAASLWRDDRISNLEKGKPT